jgi:site-specific DNA-methyltransferase (adenine-specific)
VLSEEREQDAPVLGLRVGKDEGGDEAMTELPKPYFERDGITLYHGDCREILPLLPKCGLCVTDPPYGVGIEYIGYDDDAKRTLDLVFDFVKLALTTCRCIAFTAGRYETELALYKYLPPKWRLCWYNGSQSTASAVGFNDWEAVLVYGDKIHNNAHDHFYAMPEKMGGYGHPCPKPISFAKTIINRLSRPNEIILDPFCGSGTTLVAAKLDNRKAIGIEIEERYCAIAARRLEQGVFDFKEASA